MNWQEKYFEIALKAVTAGRDIQRQLDHNINANKNIYDKEARKIAHETAEELDRLHDKDIPYKPKNNANCDEKEPF